MPMPMFGPILTFLHRLQRLLVLSCNRRSPHTRKCKCSLLLESNLSHRPASSCTSHHHHNLAIVNLNLNLNRKLSHNRSFRGRQDTNRCRRSREHLDLDLDLNLNLDRDWERREGEKRAGRDITTWRRIRSP